MKTAHHITEEELMAKFMALPPKQQEEVLIWLACNICLEDAGETL